MITWKSRFSHDTPKRCKFAALLHFKAGFLMTRQNLLYLYSMHYYVEKQVFSKHAKKVLICCIITFRSRFSHDAPKLLYFMHYNVEKQVFSWHAKKCKFVALLRGKAGIHITRKKLVYFMYDYVEKQVFSWHAKKVQICCIITFQSRFSHDAPKSLIFIFDALLRGKAGFLMTRQKGANLLHYYVSKQVFSWRAKTLIFYAL